MPLQKHLPSEYALVLKKLIERKTQDPDAIHILLSKCDPRHATSISLEMRRKLSNPSIIAFSPWEKPSLKRAESKIMKFESQPYLAAALSVSWNGYLRHAAVNHWGKIHSPFELALLIIRLNDWVFKVREAAEFKIQKLLTMPQDQSGLTPHIILGCMDLILDSTRFMRCEPSQLKTIYSLSLKPGVPEALANYIHHSEFDDAARFLKLGLRQRILTDVLENLAAEAKHRHVRRIAVKALLDGKFIWKTKSDVHSIPVPQNVDTLRIATRALSDPFAEVQSVALDYVIEEKPKSLFTENHLREFTRSKRISVQSKAIYGLTKLGIDFTEEVRAEIRNGHCDTNSIAHLGRYGQNSDGDLLYKCACTFEGSKRLRALGAAAKQKHKRAIEEIEHIAFNNVDDSFARQASNILRSIPYMPSLDLIVQSVRSNKNVRLRGYLFLLKRLPTMKLAVAMAEILQSPSGYDIEDFNLWHCLVKKRNVGAFTPSENEIHSLRDSLGQDEKLKKRFADILGLGL